MRMLLSSFVLTVICTLTAAGSLSPCCNALANAGLGDSIVAPGVHAYDTNVQKYFSLAADLRPQCFLQPTNTTQVSLAVKTLVAANKTQLCQFAIRSGGHAHFPGAAGIEDGVTIDLGKLNEVIWNPESSTVSVGPGATWGDDVYSTIDKLGVMVVGGRSTTIGVGGLILGGGNSYFAARYGLACDNVLQFEVVLGDGAVVIASINERPDLFQVLKGSSNNIGIVTRFDLMAFDNGPNGTIFGGIVMYPATTSIANQQFDALVDFGNRLNAIDGDPYGSAIVISTYMSGSPQPLFVNAYDYTRPGSNRTDAEEVFKDFWAIPGNVSDGMGHKNMTTLAREFEAPKDHRVSFSTLTFVNNVQVMHKAQEAFLKGVQAINASATGDWAIHLLFQPLPASFTKHGLRNGGNVLGLDRFNGTLVVLQPYLRWQGEEQDELFQALAKLIRDEVSSFAKSVMADNPWLYLNYADKDQDPLTGYGEANVAKIQAASAKYDPEGVFQYMVPGGFKISALERDSDVRDRKHRVAAITGAVCGGIVTVILATLVGCIWWKRKHEIREPGLNSLQKAHGSSSS